MSVQRFVVPAHVFAKDVLRNVEPEQAVALADALREGWEGPGLHAADTDSRPDELLVHELLVLPLPEGGLGDWLNVLSEAGADARHLRLLEQLRVTNDPGFSVVHGAESVAAQLFVRDEGGELRVPNKPSRETRLGAPVYTLGLTVDVRHPAPPSFPRNAGAAREGRPRRPYPADPTDALVVEGLAQHLAPRLGATIGGAERVHEHPVLAPLCAMTGAIFAVMKATGKGDVFRHGVLDACLDALDLAGHRSTAERLLLRDHEAHIHVDVSALPDRMASPNWNGGLGLFAKDAKGQLVKVTTEMRKSLMPRVLFNLCEPEPR